jgi:hypothetical protein
MAEPFSVGVEPGGLNDYLQIKILICYLLSKAGGKCEKQILFDAVAREGLVNYFDMASMLSEAKDAMIISEDNECNLVLESRGEKLCEEFYKVVPLSVRDKCAKVFLKLHAKTTSAKNNKAEIEETNGGYLVKMAIPDKKGYLMNLELLVADEVIAKKVKDLFLENTSEIYKSIIAIISGDKALTAEFLADMEMKKE